LRQIEMRVYFAYLFCNPHQWANDAKIEDSRVSVARVYQFNCIRIWGTVKANFEKMINVQ